MSAVGQKRPQSHVRVKSIVRPTTDIPRSFLRPPSRNLFRLSRAPFRARQGNPCGAAWLPTLTVAAGRAHAKACRLRGECRSCLTRGN